MEGAKSLVVDNNSLESTAGIHVLGYDGNHTAAQTIKVTHNRAKNIDGRRSNGAGGWMDFNVRTNVTSGGCSSWEWIRSRVPSARESSISVPAVGLGHTGVAVTSTKPRAADVGADRVA